MNFSTFLVWETALGDAFIVRGTYVKLVGDFKAGALLSRIIYYYLPGKSGRSKLRVKKGDTFWIAKTRSEWCEEIYLTEKELDGALRKLSELDLIVRKTYKFNSVPALHVRLVKETFLGDLEKYLASVAVDVGLDFDPMEVSDEAKPVEPDDTEQDDAEKVYCPECSSPKVVAKEHDWKRRCPYCLLLAAWEHFFPDKPQPMRTTRKFRRLAEDRWRKKFFRDNYVAALKRAAESPTLKEGWFVFQYFVRDDEKVGQMLPENFWMEWKDEKTYGKIGPKKGSTTQM